MPGLISALLDVILTAGNGIRKFLALSTLCMFVFFIIKLLFHNKSTQLTSHFCSCLLARKGDGAHWRVGAVLTVEGDVSLGQAKPSLTGTVSSLYQPLQ